MNLIVAKNLSKTYATDSVEVKALQEVNFEIEPGAFLAFIGPSGSGKTTLLNLVGCLDKPTGGELQVAGTDVLKLDRRQAAEFRGQNIGFIFQSFNLIAVLTAFENVEYPLVMVQELPLAERRDRVLKALQSVGMLEQKNQLPEQLSGGQKQRLSIARALARKPDVYIFDDSFSALDFQTDAKLRAALEEETKGKTVLIVGQRVATIMHAAKIVVLEEGKVAGIGTHAELLRTCGVYRQIAESQLSEEELRRQLEGSKEAA